MCGQSALQPYLVGKEWAKLENIGGTGIGAWDIGDPHEWTEVRNQTSGDPTRIHIGSLHELCVEKGSELRPKVSVGQADDVAMALLQQLS